jgi:hypothetical protein
MTLNFCCIPNCPEFGDEYRDEKGVTNDYCKAHAPKVSAPKHKFKNHWRAWPIEVIASDGAVKEYGSVLSLAEEYGVKKPCIQVAIWEGKKWRGNLVRYKQRCAEGKK